MVENISFNLLNKVWDGVKLLTVAIRGFLNSSLIAAILKVCLTHQYAN